MTSFYFVYSFPPGKIAQELEYVNHQVRSKLDELKRTELDRLRELAKRQYELSEGQAVPEAPGHVDHHNPHSFEINDLHKLIVQVIDFPFYPDCWIISILADLF